MTPEPTPEPPGPRRPVTARLPVALVTRVVWIGVATLILGTFAAQILHRVSGPSTVVALFDSDQKLNFPSAAKILLLLGSSLLFAAIGLTASDRWQRVRWFGMGAVFALLTLDEMTYMHQRLSDALHEAAGTHGALRFAWVLVYVPVVAVLAVVYWPFWRRLAPRLRAQLLAAALLFGGGSAGIELVKGVLYDDDRWSLSFGLAAAVSDSCELIGLALIVTVLLRTLAGSTAALEVALDPH